MPEFIFVHGNDTHVTEKIELLFRKKKPIIYSGQFSSVSPYPDNDINLSVEEKRLKNNIHLKKQIRKFLLGASNTNASILIPCAGPVLKFNNLVQKDFEIVFQKEGPFDFEYLKKEISGNKKNKKILFLKPGDKINNWLDKDLEKLHLPINKTQKTFFIENLIDVKQQESFIPNEFDSGKAKRFFKKIVKYLDKLELFFKAPLGIFVKETKVLTSIHLNRNGKFEINELVNQDPNDKEHNEKFILIFNAVDLYKLYSDKLSFEEIWYGGTIKVKQSELGFFPEYILIMNFIHNKILMQSFINYYLETNKKYISVTFKGKVYKIKRYCPHKGVDLKNCKPDKNGVITCSGHFWKFSIFDGKCISGPKRASIKYDEDKRV